MEGKPSQSALDEMDAYFWFLEEESLIIHGKWESKVETDSDLTTNPLESEEEELSSKLEETHIDPSVEDSWWLEWGDRVYFSHLTVRTAGVATLFFPNLRPKVLGFAEAVSGRLLHLQVRMEGPVVIVVNVYATASIPERLQFYQRASAFLGTLDPHECLDLGGYFNTTLEKRGHLGTEQCPATADILRKIVEHHSQVDVWRPPPR
ncbi:unnamed protein product [Caretta caretta]